MQFQTRSTVPNYFEVSLLWLVANNLFSFSRLLPTTLEQKSEPALRWEDLTIVGAVIKRAFELGWGENCTGGDGGRWWPSMVATSTGHQQAFIRSEPGQWQACRGPTTATERPCKGSQKPSRAECPGSPYDRAYDDQLIYCKMGLSCFGHDSKVTKSEWEAETVGLLVSLLVKLASIFN